MTENKNTQTVNDKQVFSNYNTDAPKNKDEFKKLNNKFNNVYYVNDSSYYTRYKRVLADKSKIKKKVTSM